VIVGVAKNASSLPVIGNALRLCRLAL